MARKPREIVRAAEQRLGASPRVARRCGALLELTNRDILFFAVALAARKSQPPHDGLPNQIVVIDSRGEFRERADIRGLLFAFARTPVGLLAYEQSPGSSPVVVRQLDRLAGMTDRVIVREELDRVIR